MRRPLDGALLRRLAGECKSIAEIMERSGWSRTGIVLAAKREGIALPSAKPGPKRGSHRAGGERPVPSEYLRAAIVKIRAQFPNTPEGRLCFSVVAGAIAERDARYLSGRMLAAELCGVDSGWIRRVLLEVRRAAA